MHGGGLVMMDPLSLLLRVCVHGRRNFPAQTLLFEQKVLPHLNFPCLCLAYMTFLHLWLFYLLTSTASPSA